jgi:hypothetical protein
MLDRPASTTGTPTWKPAPGSATNGGNGHRPPGRVLPLLVTGQNVAKARRTRSQRLRLVEYLVNGRVALIKPTIKQAAALARVSVAEVYRDRRSSKPKPTPPSLADRLRTATPAERLEAARAIGVDQVWDSMVLPLVSSVPAE